MNIEHCVNDNEHSINEQSRSEIVHILDPSEHLTSNMLTKFELTEVISIRIGQIENNGQIYTDNIESHVRLIAINEIIEKKCPLTVRRHAGINTKNIKLYEDIPVNDLILPNILFEELY